MTAEYLYREQKLSVNEIPHYIDICDIEMFLFQQTRKERR